MKETMLAGRYRLGSIIGRGGMAVVYRADDLVLGRPVAIKMLHASLADDPGVVARFEREATSAARLSHPAIVQSYDIGSAGADRFIVMELVEGRDLKQIVQAEGPLPAAEVARIGRDIAVALAFAHRQGIIHRDVKPQNVLLDSEGRVRLTDFGIARAIDGLSTTQTGTVLGTAHYLAPELAQGQSADARSDIYSLGALLYELATGQPPFDGASALTVALRQVQEIPVPPSRRNHAVPAALESVILRALAKEPVHRFPSADDLAQALVNPIAVNAGPDRRLKPTLLALPRSSAGSEQLRRREPPTPRQGTPVSGNRATSPRRRRGGGQIVVFLLGASISLVALGIFWILSANRPGPAAVASTPTATLIPLPVGARTPTVTSAPTASLTPAPTATTAPSATPTRPAPTASPVPTAPPRPANVPVPALVGQSLVTAQQQLTARGLVLTFSTTADPKQPDGVVLDQRPASGELVPPGSPVNLVVNRLATIAVPNVQGLEEGEARRTLEKEGLRPVVERGTGGRKGVVNDQSPQPGIRVQPGAEVRITVGS